MKRLLTGASLLVTFLMVLPLFLSSVNAAFLKFDKTTTTLKAGETIDAVVVVDAGTDQITSVDAYVTYDSTLLQAQSVADGTFFPTVFNDITTQRVYVAGIVNDPSTFKEGSGNVATITFKALKDGTATLAYKCDSTASETSKVIKNDFNATNVIECSKNTTLVASIGVGATVAPTTAASTGGTSTVEELPQSGILENIVRYGGTGMGLLVVGLVLRLL